MHGNITNRCFPHFSLIIYEQIFVALFPCNECSKIIIQSGIKEVVYLSDKYGDTSATKASKRLLQMAGVRCPLSGWYVSFKVIINIEIYVGHIEAI